MFFERWGKGVDGGVIQESNYPFFKWGHCQITLLVSKTLGNINLGQRSYLNFNKFGIGNNVPDCLWTPFIYKLWASWSIPRLDFYASTTATQQPVTISNTFKPIINFGQERLQAAGEGEGRRETLKERLLGLQKA